MREEQGLIRCVAHVEIANAYRQPRDLILLSPSNIPVPSSSDASAALSRNVVVVHAHYPRLFACHRVVRADVVDAAACESLVIDDGRLIWSQAL